MTKKIPVVRNSKGERILLNARERQVSEYWERTIKNALGYEVSITTLTTIVKKISEQKFFQIAPADYVPIKVGEGTWSSNITTYRSFIAGDEFESGIINTGADSS